MRYRRRKHTVLGLLCAMSSPLALGLGANLYGTLVVTPPECVLNNNNQVPIHFGDILLTRIDGDAYRQSLPLSNFDCTDLVKNTLTFTFIGDPTSFNSNGALKTSNNKLGIVFYVNGTRQPINEPVNVNYTALPSLTVAPVKNSGASFINTDGGNFTALATLKVNYQ